MKSKQLNQAINDGFERGFDVVVTLDDDIVHFLDLRNGGKVNAAHVINDTSNLLIESDYYLGGVYSGSNAVWSPGVASRGRILGAFMLHKRGSVLRFDESLPELVDLDYCVNHHVRYGGVLMNGRYSVKNLFTTNSGGLQNYRSDQTAEFAISRLMDKWGHLGCKFSYNGTRPLQSRIPWKKLCECKNTPKR